MSTSAAFFGHGTPMNAIDLNHYSTAWREFGAQVERPRAVLMISAHWFTRGTAVTAMERPRTIHDFGGFPSELYAVQYPAPGDPALAARVAALGGDVHIGLDAGWGLDHGAWSVLIHTFPDADVPVVQLSIDGTRPASWHWDFARRLDPLRDDGVMIMGSGNVTHNFGELDPGATEPAQWAVDFDARIWDAVQRGDRSAIVDYEATPDGRRAAPTADHYLPLVYIAALRRPEETASAIVTGIDLGSFSMRAFSVGTDSHVHA
ncbi:MAG: 4,5-DOPA dioxygenase extradiol [Acidimicrobiales bacterium]